MKFNKVLIALALVMLFAVALSAYVPAATPPASTPPTDKIGVVAIKSGEPIHIAYWLVVAGPDASLGEDSKRGIEIAIDDKGGKLLGRPIKLSGTDSACNAEGGTTAATKLSADSTIVALIGSSCSSEAAAGVPILTKAGFTTVSPSNTRTAFTVPPRPAGFEGYLRTAHEDAVQGKIASEFIWNQLKLKTAATIHDGSPYSKGLVEDFAKSFKQLGGKLTSEEAIDPNQTDMRSVLTKVSADKPQFVYYPVFIAAGGHITRQARETTGLKDAALMGADGMFSPDFMKAAGSEAEGMYLSSPDVTAFAAGYKEFLEKHRKKYGGEPLSIFHAHTYDAANIIFNAIEKVAVTGPDGTVYIGRQALRDALYATKNHKGLTGTLSCDEHGDCSDPAIAICKITAREAKDGKWPPEKPFWVPPKN
ncbi:MAG: branched-chain amino acid ABC transporter substrate-binding protein [Candidatus Tectomicrobia bacterium]|nr:branched-chain amino acid ABC transporter substrate-binding protein [Candidatus Tectomicrobia bacterium]